MTTNDVFHRVHSDDPTFATKGGAEEITEDHTGVEGGVRDQTNVATAGGPGVVDAAEEHGLKDQQQAADAKKNQVITNDVGHLIFVAPVLGEEGGIVLQNLRTTQGVVQTTQAKNG